MFLSWIIEAMIAFGGRILENGEPKYLEFTRNAFVSQRSDTYGIAQAFACAQKQQLIVVEGYGRRDFHQAEADTGCRWRHLQRNNPAARRITREPHQPDGASRSASGRASGERALTEGEPQPALCHFARRGRSGQLDQNAGPVAIQEHWIAQPPSEMVWRLRLVS